MENLVKSRSTIVFLAALLTAVALALWIERESARSTATALPRAGGAGAAMPTVKASADLPQLQTPRALSDTEKEWARIAWTYFERNLDARTGLVGSVAGFQGTTMWDTASYLLALISAERLALVARDTFDDRLTRALSSLARMPLYDGALPNKSYRTSDLAMADYRGEPSAQGIGWSAIDIGRLLVPLHVIVWHYPEHTREVLAVLSRFDLARASSQGQLIGMSAEPGAAPQRVQEGRLGYEQYAARSFALAGVDVRRALDYFSHLAHTRIYDIDIPHDSRDPSRFGAQNFVVSEPYMLDGLEFGWDEVSREFAWRVYRAQEERFARTGSLTAVSEDHVDRPPYFVYNSVFNGGKAWAAITEQGADAGPHRSLSSKTAFAWHALYRTPYTEKLMAEVAKLHDKDKGWYAGRYEEDGQPNRALTLNTNAIILESLAYIASGRMLAFKPREGQ